MVRKSHLDEPLPMVERTSVWQHVGNVIGSVLVLMVFATILLFLFAGLLYAIQLVGKLL